MQALAKDRDLQVIYVAEDLNAIKTDGAVGVLSTNEAMDLLLKGTGLTYSYLDERTIAIVPLARSGASGVAVSPGRGASGAQAAKSQDLWAGVELDEIIVTATRRAERLLDVPMSITALSRDELSRRGVEDINDVVANSPGLSNPAQGMGWGNNLIIRGVATGAGSTLAQSTASFLLDDIDLNPGAVAFGSSNPKIVDVVRVEVLRGPQGTLFGAGSLSGAVRFISNKPDLEDFSASLSATGASTEHGGDSGNVTAVLNAPLIRSAFAARLVAYAFDDAGWVDDPMRGVSNVNEARTHGLRLTLSAKPTDELSLVFTALNDRAHELGSRGTYYYPPQGLANYEYQQPFYSVLSSQTDSHIYNLLATWEPTWGTLVSTSNYYYRVIDGRQDLGAVLPTLGLADAATNPSGPSIGPNSIRNFSQEFRFDSREWHGYRVSLGAYYGRVGSNPSQIITTFLPSTPLLLDVRVHTVQWQAAFYGTATYTWGDRLDFTAGLRVSRDVVHFSTTERGYLAGNSTPPSTEIDSPVTPRAAMTFRQTHDLTWYLQAAKGYRVGGPNVTAGNETQFASYGPDSLWNFELGSKARLFNGTLSLNTSLYDIEWSDMQVGLTTSAGFNYIGNGGKARIYGLEEELTWRASSWLELGGTVSADRARTTSSAAINRVSFGYLGAPPDLEPTAATMNGVRTGYRLPGSPQLQGSLYGELQFHVMGHEAFVRLSGQYAGSAYTDFNAEGLRFGDFATASLRAGISLGRVKITTFLNNITDSTGATSAIDASLFNIPTAFRTRPRTVGVSLKTSF